MDGSGGTLDFFIDDFINKQVIGKGLDERTQKAYRLDLEHFYQWMDKEHLPENMPAWEGRRAQYLTYLFQEKRLRTSTISRKNRVFGYFLAYLKKQGAIAEGGSLEDHRLTPRISGYESQEISKPKEIGPERQPVKGPLSKQEVDAFFQAIRREQEELDSDFRRRLCLRDQIMMGLLFYHRIEVSELLMIQVADYDLRSGILSIRKKRQKGYCVCLFSKELRRQMEQWLDEHEYFERDEEFKERMFLSKLGRPLSMKMVILIFEKYRVMAGIEKEFTPKDLKNSLGPYGQELVREQCG